MKITLPALAMILLLVYVKVIIPVIANDKVLISYINKNNRNPIDYLMDKLKDNDIVLLGAKHNQDHQLEIVQSFIRRMQNEMPSTILALKLS